MEELLQKLLEADILSESTKTDLEDAFKSQLDEAIVAAKEVAAADVKAELTEQWVTERDTLVEAVDTQVGEYLEIELNELRSDIERFRDLEAESAEKLVEAKAAMQDELKADLSELVEKIDAFLEIRLNAELEELREDIAAQRKNEFGRKIYEAFAKEFNSEYADPDSAEVSLRETEQRLGESQEALEAAERELSVMKREQKMSEVLSPLTGRQRDVMEAILKNVETTQLDEGYETFIGRVIRETDEVSSEKENKVLAEASDEDDEDDKDDANKDTKFKKKMKKSGKDDSIEDEVKEGVVTLNGDTENVINESVNTAFNSQLAQMRKLAGIQ